MSFKLKGKFIKFLIMVNLILPSGYHITLRLFSASFLLILSRSKAQKFAILGFFKFENYVSLTIAR
jgi:hypothetical protein